MILSEGLYRCSREQLCSVKPAARAKKAFSQRYLQFRPPWHCSQSVVPVRLRGCPKHTPTACTRASSTEKYVRCQQFQLQQRSEQNNRQYCRWRRQPISLLQTNSRSISPACRAGSNNPASVTLEELWQESTNNSGDPSAGEKPQLLGSPSDSRSKASKAAALSLPQHWHSHVDRVRNQIKKRHMQSCMLRVAEINQIEPLLRGLSDEELRNKTEEFKMRLSAGKDSLDSLLPEAFAVVREAARRYINMRHFDTQLIGGMVLHEGKIAEMGTGEGKTLVATLPAYLNALTGKGVHVVTVNNYLAARDAEWMGSVFRALGLTVGVCLDHAPGPRNQAALNCDITYITAQNLAWIYLADNSSIINVEQLSIQRPFNYAIVDEADSVLIDDAANALIISTNDPSHNPTQWKLAAQVCTKAMWARKLRVARSPASTPVKEGFEEFVIWDVQKYPRNRNGTVRGPGHILLNSTTRELEITDAGHTKIFEMLKRLGYSPSGVTEGLKEPGDLWNGANSIGPLVFAVLKAHTFQKDVDYILRDGKVIILSQNSGRALEKSRWNEGMHQAVEVKEGIEPGISDIPFARITYQLFFNFYSKLSGMTGTARSADKELNVQYRLAVESVPPHKPCIRKDHAIEIFIDSSREIWSSSWPQWHKDNFQFNARKDERVARLVVESIIRGQPVLLGTTSVEESEDLEEMLKRMGIPSAVLNARPEAARREASIIAQAGMPQTRHRWNGRVMPAVTISTSMAGRGTDIRLGGDPQGIMRTAITCLLMPFMTTETSHLSQDECPLSFWPPDNSLAGLRRHIPADLHSVLRSASSAVMTQFFDRNSKLSPEDAKKMLMKSFTKAERIVNSFILETRQNFGSISNLSEDHLMMELEDFSQTALLIFPLSQSESNSNRGLQSRIDKAVVWMWIWLELYCTNLAAEARAAGGLRVICTSLGPSWRILDQFRGRSGRQGDPGESFVILNLNQDILRTSPVKAKQLKQIESRLGSGSISRLEEFTQEPMDFEWATKLATGPYMHSQESRSRDHRVNTKETDEVLSLIRDQVFAFRRWIISAEQSQLHAMLRTFCFDAATDIVLDSVNLTQAPDNAAAWNIEQALVDTWKVVNGARSPDRSLQKETDDVSNLQVWVSSLLGVDMSTGLDLEKGPQAGTHSNAGLRILAEQLRGLLTQGKSLIDELGRDKLDCSPHVDLDFVLEQMKESEEAFKSGANSRFPELKSRHQGSCLQLISILALVLYLAWLGPRRAAIKRQLALQVSMAGIKPYDSFLGQSTPQDANRSVDLEDLVEDWERRSLAQSLQALWTNLLQFSEMANQAASFAFISHLKPLEEYTSSMTAAYIQLLNDHRVLSIYNLFCGPDWHGPSAPTDADAED